MPAPSSRFLPLVIAVLILVLGVLAWKLVPDGKPSETSTAAALVGGPFSLVDHTGKRVTEQNYRGKFMLVFFGYTYCPDVCPMELMTITNALDQLPKDITDKIQPLFITVDPSRDSVPVLADFVTNFTPKLVALTGSEDEIKAASRAYRVYYQKTGDANDPDYLMDHSAIVFLMGPKGEYVSHFSNGVTSEAMARKLREIVK